MKNAASQNNYSPPRQDNTNRCGNHHIAAVGFNQSKTNMTGAKMNQIVAIQDNVPSQETGNFTQKQIDILKNSLCKGVSNEEFEVFLMACSKTKLDPFMRQIYAVKRKSKKPDGTWGETMTIQTGIDGYRLIGERTGRYAPGQEATYAYDQNGKLLSATAYVKKMTDDGTWHMVSASAYIDEYMQTSTDRATGEKKPSGMWGNMPRTMLAKCAEALALRKAFPAELSGVYTKEEMMQAEAQEIQEVILRITPEQGAELDMILGDCDLSYRNWVNTSLKKQFNIDNISDLPADMYSRVKTAAVKNMEANRSRQEQNLVMEQSVFAEAS